MERTRDFTTEMGAEFTGPRTASPLDFLYEIIKLLTLKPC